MPIRGLESARPVGIGMGANVWPALGEKAMDLTGDIVQQENQRENAAINAFYKIWLEADSPEQLKALQDSPNFSRVVQSAQRLGLPVEQDPAVPGNLRFPYGPTIRGIQDREKLINQPQLPTGVTPEQIQAFDTEALAAARTQAGPNGQPMPGAAEAQLTAERGKVQRPKWSGIFKEPSGWNLLHEASMTGTKESAPIFPREWQNAMRERGIDPRQVFLDLQAQNISKEQAFEIASGGGGDLAYKYMAKEYPGRYRVGSDGQILDKATGEPISSPAQELRKVPVFGPMMVNEYVKNGALSKESLALLASDVMLTFGMFPGLDPNEAREKMNQVRAGSMNWEQMAAGAAGARYSALGQFMLKMASEKKGKDENTANLFKALEFIQKGNEHQDKVLQEARNQITNGANPEIFSDLLKGYTTSTLAQIKAIQGIPGLEGVDLGKLFTPVFTNAAMIASKTLANPFDPKTQKPSEVTNRFMNFNIALNELPSKDREMVLRDAITKANMSQIPYIRVDKESLMLEGLDTPLSQVLNDPIYAKLFGDVEDPILMIPYTSFKTVPLDIQKFIDAVNNNFDARRLTAFHLDPRRLQTYPGPSLVTGNAPAGQFHTNPYPLGVMHERR